MKDPLINAIAAICVQLIAAGVVMFVWNHCDLSTFFNLKEMEYPQALGLVIISNMLVYMNSIKDEDNA